jgi:hypothetical protein
VGVVNRAARNLVAAAAVLMSGSLLVSPAYAADAAHATLIGERDVNVNANLTYSGSGTAAVNVQAVRDIHVGANVASLAVNETSRNEKRGRWRGI